MAGAEANLAGRQFHLPASFFVLPAMAFFPLALLAGGAGVSSEFAASFFVVAPAQRNSHVITRLDRVIHRARDAAGLEAWTARPAIGNGGLKRKLNATAV
jgi:hypothetical protein